MSLLRRSPAALLSAARAKTSTRQFSRSCPDEVDVRNSLPLGYSYLPYPGAEKHHVIDQFAHGYGRSMTLNMIDNRNAMNLYLVRQISKRLQSLQQNPQAWVYSLRPMLDSKVFSVGPDLKAMLASVEGKNNYAHSFLAEFHNLAMLVHKFPKHFVPLLDGFTSASCGLLGGRIRVASQNTIFSVTGPECGYFPDAGAMHQLSRLESVGLYLALTGHHVKGFDVWKSTIAPNQSFDRDFAAFELLSSGSATQGGVEDAVNALLTADFHPVETRLPVEQMREITARFHEWELTPHLDLIDRCFGADKKSVEDVLIALEKEAEKGSNFAAKAVSAIKQRSPLSLKVTFAGIRTAVDMPFGAVLKRDFAIANNFLRSADFKAGVETRIVRRQKDVKFSTTFDSVTDDVVASFFQLPADVQDNFLVGWDDRNEIKRKWWGE